MACIKMKDCPKHFRSGDSACRSCKDFTECDAPDEVLDDEDDAGDEEDDGDTVCDEHGNEGVEMFKVKVMVKVIKTETHEVEVEVAADDEDEAKERAVAVVDTFDWDDLDGYPVVRDDTDTEVVYDETEIVG